MRIPRTTNVQYPASHTRFRTRRRSPLRRGSFDVGGSLFAVSQRAGWAGLVLFPFASAAEPANPVSLPSPLPDVGLSLLRVFGALALVLAIFLGGVWLFRNWQRLVIQGGRAPRLNVLEVRSLGGRHVLYVVGYQQERFLIAASPAGVNLVSHLEASDEEITEPKSAPPASFARALARVLKGK